MSKVEGLRPHIQEQLVTSTIKDVDIPATTRPPEAPATYHLEARSRKVEGSKTAFFLVHGSAEPNSPTPNPIDGYDDFFRVLADDGKISSFVFHSRGVGTGALKSDGNYAEISIDQRVTDTVNALFAMSQEMPDVENIVIGAVSMGGHVAIRALEEIKKLSESVGPEQEEAKKLLSHIKGFAGFAPAAYLEEIEDLPAGNPQEDKNNPDSRTFKLRNPSASLATSPVFESLDTNFPDLPIIMAFGQKDHVIPIEVKDRFMRAVYDHDGESLRNWVASSHLSEMEHGLLARKPTQTTMQKSQQDYLFQSVIGFAQRVSQSPR